MNERELADLFNQEWEASHSGAPRPGEALPEPVRQALDTAWKVSRTDFSAESRLRDATRRKLLLGQPSARTASPVRRGIGSSLAGWFGLAGFATAMVLLVLGLSWLIRSSLPSLTPLTSAAPSQVAALAPAGSPTPEATREAALAVTELVQAPPVLGLESLPETIRAAMLNPAWDSLWIQGQVLEYGDAGVPSTIHVQSWLDRRGGGRVTSSDALAGEVAFDISLKPRFAIVSQGDAPRFYDQQTGKFDPTYESILWDIHPLEGANPLLQMVFPRDLPDNLEDMQVAGYASQAGRPAVILDWAGVRYWVDQETGLVLRRQTRDKSGNLVEDARIDSILYNPPIPETIYNTLPLENAAAIETPSGVGAGPTAGPGTPESGAVQLFFESVPVVPSAESTPLPQDDNQNPTEEPQDPPTATPTPSPQGSIQLTFFNEPGESVSSRGTAPQLFFVMRSAAAPFDRQLASVDAGCLYAQASCPALIIPGLPAASDSSLHWSPDGRQAVLFDASTARLLRFDPQEDSWASLVDGLRMTSDLALWSPDGSQIAVTLEGSDTGDSLINLVIPGEDAKSTEVKTLTADLGGMQTPLAWQDEASLIFMRHSTQQKDGSGQDSEPALYWLDLRTASVSPLPAPGGSQWLKNYPAASPDGARLVVSTPVEGQQQLAVIELAQPDGAEVSPTPLGMDGINPVWSPDGHWIAFTAASSAAGANVSSEDSGLGVFIIRPDGNALQQVFQWGTLPEVAWAPDSGHLLVVAYPSGATPENERTLFYLVTLPEGRAQQIAPEAAYDRYDLIAPAFRPSPSP